ncbi:hypothetical protein DL764_004004 [Monosporascus ibericus]|uniref:DNA repair protein rad5 n=1 Tax=Monosporascus ibericus TaxID=155417 RepID=A0A4Q4THY9_9PEZI|nr:hypothetical protein DL764_004004 [Monosporascus ibericus]
MSIRDLGEPPTKKRRFFAEPEEDSCTRVAVADSNAGLPRSPPRETAVDDVSNRAAPLNGHPATSSPASAPVNTSEPPAFDENTFESLLGDKVKPEVLDIIRANCGNNLEQAVNMYFDGTWMRFRKPRPAFNAPNPLSSRMPPVSVDHSKEPDPPPKAPITQSMPQSRYIGAFGVEGWATRSGTNLLKHGETVRIERQKIQPPNGRSLAPQRVPLVVSKRVDVIVRFTDAKGNEIGRLAKDTANWVSSLIDQRVCRFEGTCVYAPERLRTNDTIFLQLKCYLLRHAFLSSGFHLSENRSTGVFEEKETAEERDLRLRQVALVRLFQEINLLPTRTSDAVGKHNRQDLLQAAETADKQDQGTSKSNDRDAPGSSPPSEDAEEGQELEQDQLDTLYQKAQSFDFSTPEAEPPDTFAMTLRPYQKQSLYWMLRKEKDLKNEVRESSMHPLWEEYSWPTKDADDKDVVEVDGQSKFYVNPYSGEMSLDFPVQEQHCLGGILADEMGLGKTIQMLSLIHSHKSEAVLGSTKPVDSVNDLPRMPGRNSASVLAAPKTTLVVAPMSLLAQWQSEAENASKDGTLRSMVYYGSDKIGDLQALCREANMASAPDLVITSYGVVLSEFSQVAKSGIKDRGLFSLNFFRIILDEAHTIKNRQSKTAKACYELAAEHRWVLTGTPIVNRLEDLFSLIRFLRVEPWNNFSFWRTFITVPFESKDFMRALDVVQTVLEPLVMRRTKEMRTPDGQLLVPLPPKSIEIVEVELSKPERDVYEHIFTRAKRTFSASVEKGTVMKAYTTIFAQILRLRQSCCHPTLVRNQDIVADEEMAGAEADAAAGLADDMDLQSLIERFTATTDDKKDTNAFGAHVLQQIRDEAANECPICAEEPMIDQTVTGCWHSACKKCLLDYIKHSTDRQEVPRCFNCREYINSRDLFQVVRQDDDPDATIHDDPDAIMHGTPKISLQRLGVNESSSKIVELIKHLRDLRREHPQIKSVVFSQFTSFMSLIEPALAKANMKCLRLDGTLTQKARAAVLNEFRESDKFTILLISLRAGGVGLNLTQAKRVYMMDPWWSFAVEAQAIDRVHRMGQEDEVKVYRFITKDSVEERMLKVQDRKKFIATSLGMMNDEEKRLQRIEDIKELLTEHRDARSATGHHRPAPATSALGITCRRNHQQMGIAGAAVRDRRRAATATATAAPAAQIPQARARATEYPAPAPSVARGAPPEPPTPVPDRSRPSQDPAPASTSTLPSGRASTLSQAPKQVPAAGRTSTPAVLSAPNRASAHVPVVVCTSRNITPVPAPIAPGRTRCSRSRDPVLAYRYLPPHPTTAIPGTSHFHYGLTCTSTSTSTSTSISTSSSLSRSSQPDEAPEHPSPPAPTPTLTASPGTSVRTLGQLAVPSLGHRRSAPYARTFGTGQARTNVYAGPAPDDPGSDCRRRRPGTSGGDEPQARRMDVPAWALGTGAAAGAEGSTEGRGSHARTREHGGSLPQEPGAGGLGTGVDGSAVLVDRADGLPVFCHVVGCLVLGKLEMSSPNYSNVSEFLSSPPAAPAEQHQRPSRQQRRARRGRGRNRGIARNGAAQQQLELQGFIVHRLDAISNQIGVLIDRIAPELFDGCSTTIGRASPIAETASRSRSATLEPYPGYQGPPTPPTEQASPSNTQQPDNLPFDIPDYTRVRSAGGSEPSPGGGSAAPASMPESLLRRRALTVAMLEVDLAETRRQLRDLRAVARYGSAVMVADTVEAMVSGLEISIDQDLDRLCSLQHEEAQQQWTTAGLVSPTRFARVQPPTPAQAQAPFAPCPSPPGPQRYAASYLTPGCAGAVAPIGSELGPDDWTYEYIDPEPDWAGIPEAPAVGFCFHVEHETALAYRRRFVSPVA